jgi:thioredoxin 1
MSYATLRTMAPQPVESKEIQSNSLLPEVNSEQEREQFLSTYRVTVVDNYAKWCGPCKMIVEPLNVLFQKYHRDGVFIMVKENAELSIPNQRLKAKVRAVPCFHFYVNGNLVDTLMGADVGKVEEMIVQLLSTN